MLALPHTAFGAAGGLDGFNAESALEFSQNGGGEGLVHLDERERVRIGKLLAVGQSLRDHFASDNVAALRESLDPEERALLDGVVATRDADTERDIWLYFFQGSLIYIGHGLAETNRLGYYNPMVDGWVLVDVSPSESGGLSLVGMAAVTGERIRGERIGDGRDLSAGAAVWLQDSALPLPVALARNHARTVEAFETRYPILAATEPAALDATLADFATLRSRLMLVGATVGSLGEPAYRATIDRLRSQIVKGDAAAIRASMSGDPPVPLQRITGLPMPARELLRPTGFYRRAEGMTIAFGVPFTGRWVLLADFHEPLGDAPPALETILLLDLNAAEGRLQ